MTWVLFWAGAFATAVGCLIDHCDRRTRQARVDLATRAGDKYDRAAAHLTANDPFYVKDIESFGAIGIDWARNAPGGPPMPAFDPTPHRLPSRPPRHESPHRNRRGF